VDISGSVQVDFTVRYADNPGSGSASDDYPPEAEFTSVSVYDSLDNNEGTDATIVNGAGSVSFTAPATVGSDTYNLYVDMVDLDYTDGEETTTETIITDRIMAYWEDVDDTRLDINVNAEWRIKAVLQYDGHALGSGDTVTSTWGGLSWDAGNSWFEILHTESSVTSSTISLTAGTEATYGITAFAENITETTVVFDQLLQKFQANTTNPGLDETAEICWVITRKYDGGIVSDFSFDLARNSTLWKAGLTNSSVTDVRSQDGTWVYDCNGTIVDNTYGLHSYTDTPVLVTWGVAGGDGAPDRAQPYDLATGVGLACLLIIVLPLIAIGVRRRK